VIGGSGGVQRCGAVKAVKSGESVSVAILVFFKPNLVYFTIVWLMLTPWLYPTNRISVSHVSQQECIHSWFYWYRFKHCDI